MAKTKLFEAWSFRLQQPAPFDDPKYAGSKSMGFSQYNTSSTAQKSTLHAPTMRALLAYAKLVSATENGQSVDGLGAIGHQGTTYRISEYRSANKTDCVVFNPVTGKFNAAQVEDGTQALKPYSVGAGNGTGSGLLFCLMPVLNEDDEFRQKFQEFVSLLESGWVLMASRSPSLRLAISPSLPRWPWTAATTLPPAPLMGSSPSCRCPGHLRRKRLPSRRRIL